MRISIVTLFPNMIAGFFAESMIKKAQDKGLVEIEMVNLRDFAVDNYGGVDDRPYGGGPGMVLRVEPIYQAISNVKTSREAVRKRTPLHGGSPQTGSYAAGSAGKMSKIQVKTQKSKIVLTSPRGVVFNQQKAKQYSALNHLTLIAGHYEGVDERVSDMIDEEVSLGDFVLTGGEIAVSALVDAVVRLLPGVLKKETAAFEESFFEVDLDRLAAVVGEHPMIVKLKKKGIERLRLLEYPQYTRPPEFRGRKVPQVLLLGDHREIDKWRLQKAFETTLEKRADLLTKSALYNR